MSNSYLSELMQSLFDDSLGDLVESLCEPPPAVGGEKEASEMLTMHVGRSNAHRAAFLLACHFLDNDASMKLLGRLMDLALEAQSSNANVPHEARRQLLETCSQLREGYGLLPR